MQTSFLPFPFQYYYMKFNSLCGCIHIHAHTHTHKGGRRICLNGKKYYRLLFPLGSQLEPYDLTVYITSLGKLQQS